MLDRVAVHQTRLRTPGLGLDARGVALGAKGLVLLPSLERLVAFVALYASGGSLEDVLRTLRVEQVRSKLGAPEVALTFAAETSDRMDRVAEVARLAGGYTFTGSTRHFVQYRDAAAPFGYDVPNAAVADGALVLYHSAFTHEYALERELDLRSLLLRLEPHLDPGSGRAAGARWICAEVGLGPALIQYFVRSKVEADVGVAEWPPESAFDEAGLRRYLFRVPDLPERMWALLRSTPGLSVHVPIAPGVAVEVGFRHPVNLRACPVFSDAGLVLFRGRGQAPLELTRLPALGSVDAFARVRLHPAAGAARETVEPMQPEAVAVPLRLVPTAEPWRAVTATWIQAQDLPTLRSLAYVLSPAALQRIKLALVEQGAFLLAPGGVEAIPVGEFFREIHPNLYIPAGFDHAPAVAPAVLHRVLGEPAGQVLILTRDARAIGVPAESFVPLEAALLEGHAWAPAATTAVESVLDLALASPLLEVVLGGVGLRPMQDVGLPDDEPPRESRG
jgi:hypothetical protein